jgi:hypothetical protein
MMLKEKTSGKLVCEKFGHMQPPDCFPWCIAFVGCPETGMCVHVKIRKEVKKE